jgi:hypothetical protein
VGRPRRRRAILPAACLALLLALVPLGLLAANPFTDLTGGPHDANIDAIYNAGVTRGCVPDQEYCPTRNVTREEMASFLARLGGLGSNPPVAHALTAQSAGNADTVGTYQASWLARAARASGTATASDGTPTVVIFTLSVTAPTAGVVVVTAGAYGIPASSGASGSCPCEGRLAVAHCQTNAVAPYFAFIDIASYFDAYADQDSASISYAFPVSPGTNTFELRGTKVGGGANISFYGQGTALFVPFGGTGGPGAFEQDEPAPVPPPTKP